MILKNLTAGVVTAFMLLFGGLTTADTPESEEQPLATFTFDKFGYIESGKEIFTRNEKEVPFPVTFNLKSFGFLVSASLYDKNIVLEYRIFPGAISRFPSRDEVKKFWEAGGASESGVGPIEINHPHGRAVFVNSKDLNLLPPDLEYDELMRNIHRLVLVPSRLVFSLSAPNNEGVHNQLMKWVEEMDRARDGDSTIVVSFKVLGVMIKVNESAFTAYVSGGKKEVPSDFRGVAMVYGVIIDIRAEVAKQTEPDWDWR